MSEPTTEPTTEPQPQPDPMPGEERLPTITDDDPDNDDDAG